VSLVLDNSVALAWCFEDEQTPAIMNLLDRVVTTGAVAPFGSAAGMLEEGLGLPPARLASFRKALLD